MNLVNFALPETNKLPQKNGCWRLSFPFGAQPIFRGDLLVSGRVDDVDARYHRKKSPTLLIGTLYETLVRIPGPY